MSARAVQIGGVVIGGGAPITVQSMLSVPAHDIDGNVKQALVLQQAGCDIIRAAVPTVEDARLIAALRDALSIPVVADIHFDYKIALEAAAAGAHKIRINPGNIGDADRVKAVADDCRRRGIPIRIGVNSGSLHKDALAKHGGPTAAAIVESGLLEAQLLERYDFTDIVLSLKSSDVRRTVEAYRLAHVQCDYPLHVGVTEAGGLRQGIIKSAVGIGALLVDGIGDTIRVSLTADPLREIEAGIDILRSLSLYRHNVNLVACPTCGRTKINVIALHDEVERAIKGLERDITVAVMGCAVNGPGEAREADIGIAGGDGCAVLFKKGEIVGKVDEADIVPALLREIEKMGDNHGGNL